MFIVYLSLHVTTQNMTFSTCAIPISNSSPKAIPISMEFPCTPLIRSAGDIIGYAGQAGAMTVTPLDHTWCIWFI